MKELGRILSNRRLIVGLVLILLLNGFLFAREQRENDYGLDLELPSSGFIFVEGTFMTTQEPVDAWAAYQRYSEWIDRARKLPLADAVTMLTDEKAALSAKITGDTDTEDDRLDYVAVNNLLAQTDYLTGYGGWLENIQKNKDNLLTFSIFNNPDSFSGRNIIKTADEFEKLQGVELTLGTDGAVDSFMSFRLTDYLLLLALLLIGLSFLDERKAGLWSVVHAAPNGRLKLAIRRTRCEATRSPVCEQAPGGGTVTPFCAKSQHSASVARIEKPIFLSFSARLRQRKTLPLGEASRAPDMLCSNKKRSRGKEDICEVGSTHGCPMTMTRSKIH